MKKNSIDSSGRTQKSLFIATALVFIMVVTCIAVVGWGTAEGQYVISTVDAPSDGEEVGVLIGIEGQGEETIEWLLVIGNVNDAGYIVLTIDPEIQAMIAGNPYDVQIPSGDIIWSNAEIAEAIVNNSEGDYLTIQWEDNNNYSEGAYWFGEVALCEDQFVAYSESADGWDANNGALPEYFGDDISSVVMETELIVPLVIGFHYDESLKEISFHGGSGASYSDYSGSWPTENDADSTKYIEDGAQYGTLPVVSKPGYELVGWFTEAQGSTEYVKVAWHLGSEVEYTYVAKGTAPVAPEGKEAVVWSITSGGDSVALSSLEPDQDIDLYSVSKQITIHIWTTKDNYSISDGILTVSGTRYQYYFTETIDATQQFQKTYNDINEAESGINANICAAKDNGQWKVFQAGIKGTNQGLDNQYSHMVTISAELLQQYDEFLLFGTGYSAPMGGQATDPVIGPLPEVTE